MCRLIVLKRVGVVDGKKHVLVLNPGDIVDLHQVDESPIQEFDVLRSKRHRGATFYIPKGDKRLALFIASPSRQEQL